MAQQRYVHVDKYASADAWAQAAESVKKLRLVVAVRGRARVGGEKKGRHVRMRYCELCIVVVLWHASLNR